jgi:hypothetical protein
MCESPNLERRRFNDVPPPVEPTTRELTGTTRPTFVSTRKNPTAAGLSE